MDNLLMGMKQVNLAYIRQYCTDRDFCVEQEFALFNRLEELPFAEEPRLLDGVALILCLEGTMSLRIADRQFVAGKYDTLVLNSQQVVSDYHISKDCRGIAFFGTKIFFQEVTKNCLDLSSLFLYVRANRIVNFSETEAYVFKAYFNAIQERMHWGNHRFISQIAITLMHAMILDLGHLVWVIQDEVQKLPAGRSDKMFSDFVNLVEINFHEQRRVGWYAEQLGISARYLSDLVKTVSKETPNDWIEKYVVMELRVLLRNSTMSIKEIAEYMHFPNQSYLGRYFKEHAGMSPTEYRKLR